MSRATPCYVSRWAFRPRQYLTGQLYSLDRLELLALLGGPPLGGPLPLTSALVLTWELLQTDQPLPAQDCAREVAEPLAAGDIQALRWLERLRCLLAWDYYEDLGATWYRYEATGPIRRQWIRCDSATALQACAEGRRPRGACRMGMDNGKPKEGDLKVELPGKVKHRGIGRAVRVEVRP